MKTVIGIDYGTQSARALLVEAGSGRILDAHTVKYPLTSGNDALANADHYEAALLELLEKITQTRYRTSIAGICVDATSLTMVPVASNGKVLSQLPGNEGLPHAQIKLWKCHTAQSQAEEARALASEMNEPFLSRTGASVSSEWMLPKLLKLRDEAPRLFEQIDLALDLCEFLTLRLTGKLSRSVGSMGYKGLWSEANGFPSAKYLNALRPGFAKEYWRLMRGPILNPGQRAGTLKSELCGRFGLNKDVAVAAGVLDGHTAPIALGALDDGDAALVVGTSNVLAIQSKAEHFIPGICGIVKNGFIPGLYGIDSGQSCTGDMLEWYVKNALPAEAEAAARKRRCSAHQILCSRISRPWENQVVAVDWWNGSRNAPCDLSQRGILMGMTQNTKPEDIYLALLQAIVCGTGEILDLCAKLGVTVKKLLVTGGVAEKNPLLMQQYADLLHRSILVAQIREGPALGAAMLAAIAAGIYPTAREAYERMGVSDFTYYMPDPAHQKEYAALRKQNHMLRCLKASVLHNVSST